ncbi:hypothetical protein [Streptomyces lunaelactis]|uniref:hypothetical protein n=1 Tax=Streptomyces lunaelactis TaxID=1535768 RepID=UPI00158483F6|nr:hypothetical protein [Streptomyces lunaelactis]NUK02938.1 hypothetical protein [Streptomyces lunaelactis]NUK17149.1 hypothetical protein [Streptomyces lunaelactis]
MSAPFRIRHTAVRKVSRAPGEETREYLDRMMRLIPGETVGLYLVGSGVVPEGRTAGLLAWFGFCVAAVVLVRLYGTADRSAGKPPQPAAVGISVVAFVVWVYAMGGPFEALDIAVPWVGSLLVCATSFLAPYVYRGEALSEDEAARLRQ